jgi:cation diffusion facilitator family transporter
MTKRARIQQITLIGLVANIFLSIIKFLIGFFGHSQAVVADALHSFSDTTSDFIILFGVKYWTAPPDESHPYGHHKIESFITILIGIILCIVAGAIGYEGVTSLMEKTRVHLSPVVALGPVLSIIIKEILFKVTYRVGLETGSSALKANAWHHRTDAISSIPVLLAVTATLIDPRLAFLDPIGAVVVSAFIIKVGLQILFTNINDLLDTGVSKEKIKDIEQLILTQENVKGVHKLRTRKLANYIYIDLHLEVDGNLTVTQGHDISENVKQNLLKNNSKIIDVMVHLEPERNQDVLE